MDTPLLAVVTCGDNAHVLRGRGENESFDVLQPRGGHDVVLRNRGWTCNGTGTHVKPVRAFQDVRPAAVGSVAVHEPRWGPRGRGGGPGRRAAGGDVDRDVQPR